MCASAVYLLPVNYANRRALPALTSIARMTTMFLFHGDAASEKEQ